MTYISLIINLPWTLLGFILSLASIPKNIKISSGPKAVIVRVRSFWWYFWHPKRKYIRGMAIGNVVLLGPLELPNDLEHELVHVRQFERAPLIHPFLYEYQNWKYGYKENKYEKEAYQSTDSIYIER